jgi:chitosanase
MVAVPISVSRYPKVADEFYFFTAVDHSESLGISYPLSLLNLYDAIIQHGDRDDPDGLPAIIDRTAAIVGGTPADGYDELIWISTLMEDRRSTLLTPHNVDTQEEWSESVGRVDALREIYDNGNYNLNPPIIINPWGDEFQIPVDTEAKITRTPALTDRFARSD